MNVVTNQRRLTLELAESCTNEDANPLQFFVAECSWKRSIADTGLYPGDIIGWLTLH